jgi:hypothetical protein
MPWSSMKTHGFGWGQHLRAPRPNARKRPLRLLFGPALKSHQRGVMVNKALRRPVDRVWAGMG